MYIAIKLEDNNKEAAREAIQTLEELGYKNVEKLIFKSTN